MMTSAILKASEQPQKTSFALPNLPVLSSANAGWDHMQLALHRQPAFYIPEHQPDQHVICVNLGKDLTLERTVDGTSQTIDALPLGEIGIYPAHLCRAFQWHQEAEFLQLYLEPALLARTQAELCPNCEVALMPHLDQGVDPLIYQIAIALKTSLEIDGTSSKLYADVMANALAVHLVSRYSTHRPSLPKPSGKLSEKKLQQVIDYIHSHLDRDVSLAELANVAQLSSYHFTRLFKQSIGLAPHQYHIRCRVDRAKQLLREKQLSFAEIAYAVGFASQGHFNYHFKRWVGVTPKVFLRQR
jgi:AraC family transcriptional regulator